MLILKVSVMYFEYNRLYSFKGFEEGLFKFSNEIMFESDVFFSLVFELSKANSEIIFSNSFILNSCKFSLLLLLFLDFIFIFFESFRFFFFI